MMSDANETSGVTTSLVLRHVRDHGGDEVLAEVMRRAQVPETLAELENAAGRVGAASRVRLLEAVSQVLGPRTLAGLEPATLTAVLSPALRVLLQEASEPLGLYLTAPRAMAAVTTVGSIEVDETSTTSVEVRLLSDDAQPHSPHDCALVEGLLAALPQLLGRPPAQVRHPRCYAGGAEPCVFEVRWEPGEPEGSAQQAATTVKLAVLRGQLEALQHAASDLVSSDDVPTVLERIVDRAATALLAPAHLLVVGAEPGAGGTVGPPMVHARGLSPERTADLAGRLVAGQDLGPGAVVVDVASTRRHHGRLAAVYGEGHRPLDDDGTLLQAYARHAAAALDLLTALDDSRSEASRATALLTLAHELAATPDAHGIAQVVARSLRGIVGCRAGGTWLWDAEAGVLRAFATTGHGPEARERILAARITPESAPELSDLLTRQDPIVIDVETASPPLVTLMTLVGSGSIVVVPLTAGETFMGAVLASWATRGDRLAVGDEAMTRLIGIGDQAATALQNAELLSTVRHQSLHDALTGVPNRVLFMRTLETTLRTAADGQATAVLFCDLDRFKAVNDRLGHAAGDELLRQAAARLGGVLEPADVIGRLSGDEFAVLLAGARDDAAALETARRLVASLDNPFRVEGHEVRVTTSVGVAVHVGPDGRGDRLLAAADSAMYEAKQRGRNQVLLAGELDERHVVPALEAELGRAVEEGQLRLFFQPVVDVSADTGDVVVGAEALLRWAHPRLGLLTPAAFLPLAEEAGLVTELDLWAVGAACRALAAWGEQGPTGSADEPLPLRVAVNLAGATLVDPRLVPAVRAALTENGLTSDRLHLEVVESRSLTDLPGVIARLVELRQMGVRISLDDFGTGFSTLTWLQTLPVDQIKIDRSFIAGLPDHAASLALVRGVVALARELDIEVIAEGVEDPRQLALLREAGCEMVQGYLLGRPGPVFAPGTPPPAPGTSSPRT